MLLLFILLIFVASVQSYYADGSYNALQFGTSSSDYVTFTYDMSPFRDSLSICTWIKQLHSSTIPTVFNYLTSTSNWDIMITSNGVYTYVAGDGGLSSTSKFTTPTGKWFSLCLTWSLSSRTSKLYLDGELRGTSTTAAGRSLNMGGQLWFGKVSPISSSNSNYRFGGQLYQFNIFADVLSAADIRKIADGGLCFDLDELSETRVLQWEDILKKSRSGSVTDTDTGCGPEAELKMLKKQFESLTGQLNRTEGKLETETGRFNASQAELETVKSQLGAETAEHNKTLEELDTVRSQLRAETAGHNNTLEELDTVKSQLGAETAEHNKTLEELDTVRSQLRAETAEHNKTLEELETCSANMTKTKSQLDGARKLENVTRWDVLYTKPYHNKVFSDNLFEQLTTSWGLLREC